MAYYKLTMTYPGGRVEEVQDTFATLEQAKEFLLGSLNRIIGIAASAG